MNADQLAAALWLCAFWIAWACMWITIACLTFLAGWALYRFARWCWPWIRRGYIALCGNYIAWRSNRHYDRRMREGLQVLRRHGQLPEDLQ